MKGIILHGGHGTRLRPLTHTGPKQLLTIANKPMSQYAVEDFIEAGVTEIAIIIGDIFPNKVKEFYGDGSRFGAKITYVYQDKPGGIAQAVGLCKDFVGTDRFAVYLGDNILKGGIKRYASRFMSSDADALLLLCEVKNPTSFGVATVRGNYIEKIVEKPKNPESNLAVTGIYFLTPRIFEIIRNLRPSWRGELEITEALQNLMLSGGKIEFDYVTGWWKDTGTPDDVLDANRLILDSISSRNEGTIESEESLQGRVIIGKNTKVSKDAVIRGPVVIGENCEIGTVYIGPYTSIGNNIQFKRGEVENSIIMNNCKISCNYRITDSIIGNDTVIADNSRKPHKGVRFIVGDGSSLHL